MLFVKRWLTTPEAAFAAGLSAPSRKTTETR
jgi:hypothetical protein